MAKVTISNVEKSFGAFNILHGVSVDVKDGEFVVLVGPSGCGKSTLLRIIAGLETLNGGSILIDDRRVNELEPKDRDIAMVFQNYALYPQMTIEQNMGFALELAGVPRMLRRERVLDAAKVLGLEALLDRYPRQLSGGQRQRVAMGRAIVRHPKVFLFDEPLSNLDAKLRVSMRSEIRMLQRRLKATTIYVTHDQIEAMTMADKIVVMNAGRIEQIGTPFEIYDNPANTFVASFLGSPAMNLIKGEVRSGSTATLVMGEQATLDLGGQARQLAGRDIIVGVRPEHVRLVQSGGAPARVVSIEPTGSDTLLTIELAGQTITCVVHERVAYAAGDPLQIALEENAAHFFDSKTQLRIASD